MKRRLTGQAMIEAMGFFSVIALLLGYALLELHRASLAAQQRIDRSRSVIWQLAPDKRISSESKYPFAEMTRPVLEPLSRLSQFELPQDNLWLLPRSDDTLAMARLTDSWSPWQSVQLSERPAQLTPSYYLAELGLNSVLQVLGWLPVTREFDPDSLRLGYIDTDATPVEIFCEEEPC